MSDTKDIISEYLAITGRPAATLSVSEFLELKKYAQETPQIQQTFVSVSQPEPEPSAKSVIMEMPRKAASKVIQEQEKYTEEDYEECYEEDYDKEQEDKTISPALMMMRSISG